MIKLLNEGQRIEYTQGDAFELAISGEESNENTKLRFIVALDETSSPIIDEQYQYANDRFIISLTRSEINRLPIGNYIFKMSLIDDCGKIVTNFSGDLIIKWGV